MVSLLHFIGIKNVRGPPKRSSRGSEIKKKLWKQHSRRGPQIKNKNLSKKSLRRGPQIKNKNLSRKRLRRGPPHRSENRVMGTGLPSSGSWQDLKDHMRYAGDVCFADTFKDGRGVVEFVNNEDMKKLLKNWTILDLDHIRVKFRIHTYIREDSGDNEDRGRGDSARGGNDHVHVHFLLHHVPEAVGHEIH